MGERRRAEGLRSAGAWSGRRAGSGSSRRARAAGRRAARRAASAASKSRSPGVRARFRALRIAAMLSALLRSLRPAQWVKNLFVLVPLVFAHRLDRARSRPALGGRLRRLLRRGERHLPAQRPARPRSRPSASGEAPAPDRRRRARRSDGPGRRRPASPPSPSPSPGARPRLLRLPRHLPRSQRTLLARAQAPRHRGRDDDRARLRPARRGRRRWRSTSRSPPGCCCAPSSWRSSSASPSAATSSPCSR